jgi:hypothetical protein
MKDAAWLVGTGVLKERIASIVRVTRIGELGTLAVIMLLRNVGCYKSHTALTT